MCYSAMVKQNAKKLGLQFKARIQTDLYLDLFRRRLNGEKLYINKAMEEQFLNEEANSLEIKNVIEAWHRKQKIELAAELEKQEIRLLAANAALSKKVTKKAEDDFRISTNKIEKLKFDLERNAATDILEGKEDRIYPLHYMSMLYLDENGQKAIAPFRYLMRPHSKDESFDVKFNGCYNARYDGLESVPWWSDSFGRRHGLIVVSKFFENVPTPEYEKQNPLPIEHRGKGNLVIAFSPVGLEFMYIPTLWDEWHPKGDGPTLLSAALITDDPAPDVLKAGHDRTPIFLKESAVEKWLFAEEKADIKNLLNERENPPYSHSLLG